MIRKRDILQLATFFSMALRMANGSFLNWMALLGLPSFLSGCRSESDSFQNISAMVLHGRNVSVRHVLGLSSASHPNSRSYHGDRMYWSMWEWVMDRYGSHNHGMSHVLKPAYGVK